MPFCGYCGNRLSDTDKFCAGCGKAAGNQNAGAAPAQKAEANAAPDQKAAAGSALKTVKQSADMVRKGMDVINKIRQVDAPESVGETRYDMPGFGSDILKMP